MRQSEREIKFISVETLLEQRPAQERTVFEQGPLVQFYTQSTGSRIGVLRVIADWMRKGVGRRVKQRPSPYGLGGETGYTAQEDLKSVSRDTMGEGGRSGSGSRSCIPFPLGFLCTSVLGSPPSSLSLFLGPILRPLLIPCSRLTICLFPISGIWKPSLRGKGVMTALASSGYRGIVGL